MEMSSQVAPYTLTSELGRPMSKGAAHNELGQGATEPFALGKKKTDWRAVICFFFLGVLIGLPSTVATTASNVMFTGFTGVYEVCASLTGATASFGSPFIARFIPYHVGTGVCIAASMLTYILCTLPHPLEGAASPESKAGPIIGVMMGGFVYAYGTNLYMAAAAFFPPEAVLGLSVGSGCSVILGPALYTGIMAGLNHDWRRTLLIFLPTVLGIPFVWWGVTDSSCRAAAERLRLNSLAKARQDRSSEDDGSAEANVDPCRPDSTPEEGVVSTGNSFGGNQNSGFGRHRTRTGLLVKTILPKYVLPLILCTSSSIVTLLGTAPTLQTLDRFRGAPEENLQFQFAFLSYGTAQFIFSILSALRPIPLVWIWTGIQIAVLVIGLLQLAHPFLTYYGVWIVMLFLTGACVGGGVTNTNHKIAEDFRRAGEEDEVRSFAMSFAGLGNFGGDALGGAFASLVQQVAMKALAPKE